MLVDLSGYKCPQLFVLFKVSLKKWANGSSPLVFVFESDAFLDDVITYLTNSLIDFTIEQDDSRITLIISGSK